MGSTRLPDCCGLACARCPFICCSWLAQWLTATFHPKPDSLIHHQVHQHHTGNTSPFGFPGIQGYYILHFFIAHRVRAITVTEYQADLVNLSFALESHDSPWCPSNQQYQTQRSRQPLRQAVVRLQQCPGKKRSSTCPPTTSAAAASSTATAGSSPSVGWSGLTVPVWRPCFCRK